MRLLLGLILIGLPFAAARADLTSAWRQAWEDFRRTYSYFGHKGVDWDQVWTLHARDFESVTDPAAFAVRLNEILQVLRDWHVAVRKPSGEFIGYHGEVRWNFDPPKFFRTRYTGGQPYENLKNAGAVLHAWVDQDIAHIAVLTLGNRFTDSISDADLDELLGRYQEAKAILFDLRANTGGNELNARRLIGRLADRDRVYGYTRTRLAGEDLNAFTSFTPKILPAVSAIRFRGPVVGLTGQGTMSSGEWMTLMIRSLPNGVLIGDTTRGASGNPVLKELPSIGVGYLISTWQAFDAEKVPFENVGLRPDVRVPVEMSFNEERDFVLERAIAFVRGASTNEFGIPDAWTVQHRLDITEQSDADGDGFLDRHEFVAGTNPRDPQSLLRVTSIEAASPAGIRIAWQSVPGKRYSIWRSSSLAALRHVPEIIANIPGGPAALSTWLDQSPSPSELWFYAVSIDRD